MALKAFVLIVVGGALQHRRLGQLMHIIEAILGFYRDILPIPLWFAFLTTWPSTKNAAVHNMVRMSYLTLKLSAVLNKAKALRSGIESFLSQQTPFGRYVRADELPAPTPGGSETVCPICHDPPTTPIRLHCSHIFCEECVAEWLQRERTCPLSVNPKHRSDASTLED